MRHATILALAVTGCVADGPGPRLWSDPVPHVASDFLFAADRINRIDIELAPDAEEILRSQRLYSLPRAEVRAAVTIDGELLPDVGVRLRGGLGSFQRLRRKPKLALDFNEFVDDRRFVGLEGLDLNNADEDCTYVREATAMAAYAIAGVPAPRVGYAHLFVNGEDKGLYVVIEPEDDRFLKRVSGTKDGALYDGKYDLAGWGPRFLDFGEGNDRLFDLDEGDDPDRADLARISAGVVAARELGGLQSLAEDVDWPLVHRAWAVEGWTAGADAYFRGRNNVRYWFPDHGPLQMLPWDVDVTFRDRDRRGWDEPAGNLAEICLADADCREQLADAADAVADAIDASDLRSRVDAWLDLTELGAMTDRFARCDDDEPERAKLRAWVDAGGERIRGWWR